MKNIGNYRTAILKISAILLIGLLLPVTILLAVTGCTTSRKIKPTPESKNEQSLPKIIIYTDFECGACAKFNLEIEMQLREFETAGIVQNQIRLLGAISDDSLRAAEAVLWAADYGRFREYHDALFRAWRQEVDDPYSKEKLIEQAESLGLDKKTLQRCLDNGSKKPELAKNMSMARDDGVDTLPTVFIGDFKIEGFKPLETYIRAIEQVIAEKSH